MRLLCKIGIHKWDNWNQVAMYTIKYTKRCTLCDKEMKGLQDSWDYRIRKVKYFDNESSIH